MGDACFIYMFQSAGQDIDPIAPLPLYSFHIYLTKNVKRMNDWRGGVYAIVKKTRFYSEQRDKTKNQVQII